MMYQAQTDFQPGPNNLAERDRTRPSIVTSAVVSTRRTFETVGGLGGAALAPPKDQWARANP
jgi:hypothetical protein